jgi:uncharacterized protein
MILPDVNLLVYAHNADSDFHEPARKWWQDLMNNDRPVGLCWASLMGFIRIVTNPKIQSHPLSVQEAFAITDEWLALPHVHWLHPGPRHYSLFRKLLTDAGTAGNLVTDAHLAALAIEHGCELHSNDSDFSGFPELNWMNPLSLPKPK